MTGPRALVQIGPDSSLVLLGDWYCLCTFSNLLGLPLGQPELVEMFAAEGSLLGRRR